MRVNWFGKSRGGRAIRMQGCSADAGRCPVVLEGKTLCLTCASISSFRPPKILLDACLDPPDDGAMLRYLTKGWPIDGGVKGTDVGWEHPQHLKVRCSSAAASRLPDLPLSALDSHRDPLRHGDVEELPEQLHHLALGGASQQLGNGEKRSLT